MSLYYIFSIICLVVKSSNCYLMTECSSSIDNPLVRILIFIFKH